MVLIDQKSVWKQDCTDLLYLSFVLCNVCAFTMVIGFGWGTSQMHSSIGPCLQKIKAESDKCTVPRFWLENPEIMECIETMGDFGIGNYDGHWSKIFIVPLLGALFNVVAVGGMWYLRNIRQISLSEVAKGRKDITQPKGVINNVAPESIGSETPPGSGIEAAPNSDEKMASSQPDDNFY